VTLENGEVLRIDCSSMQGFVTPVREAETWSTDNISAVSVDGKKGFVDLEMGMNPGRGTFIPTQADVTLLAVDDGLSETVSYDV
jgi:hypothetical protein